MGIFTFPHKQTAMSLAFQAIPGSNNSGFEKAQQKNGYLLTYFMLNCPDKEFHNLLESHELVCMGNILEAGIAWHQAVGDDFEKDLIRLLTDMLETRTEITILGRVLAHQREQSAVNP